MTPALHSLRSVGSSFIIAQAVSVLEARLAEAEEKLQSERTEHAVALATATEQRAKLQGEVKL